MKKIHLGHVLGGLCLLGLGLSPSAARWQHATPAERWWR
jgi:hypothetical protein